MAATIAWDGYGRVTNADSTTGWSVVKVTSGGGTPAVAAADGSLEGNGAVTTTSNSKLILLYYDIGAGNELNFSTTYAGQLVYVWGNFLAAGLLQPLGSLGFGIFLESSTPATNQYHLWEFYGSDNYAGGWKRMVLDPTKTASSSAGTAINLSSVRYFGIFAYTASTARFDNMVVDAIDVGNGIKVTGTSTTDNLMGDIITNEETNRYGIITSLNDSKTAFECLGKITIGDITSAATTVSDVDAKVFAGEPLYHNGTSLVASVPLTFAGIDCVGNGTGATNIDIGKKVGTGDDASGRNGYTIVGNDTYNFGIDWDDGNVNSNKWYGTTLEKLTGSLTWGTNTAHEFIGNTLNDCSQFDPVGGVLLRSLTFANYSDIDAALLWNEAIDIKNSSFIANTNGVELLSPSETNRFDDDFNRASETLATSANWYDLSNSIYVYQNAVGIDIAQVGNVFRATGVTSAGFNFLTYSDHYAQFTYLQAHNDSTAGVGVAVRSKVSGSGLRGYCALVLGDDSMILVEYENGSRLTTHDTYAGPVLYGDKIRIEAYGSAITVYLNSVEIMSVADSTLTDGGPVVLREAAAGINDRLGKIGMFSCGSITQTTVFDPIFDGLLFSNNTADVKFNGREELLTIQKVNGSNPSTSNTTYFEDSFNRANETLLTSSNYSAFSHEDGASGGNVVDNHWEALASTVSQGFDMNTASGNSFPAMSNQVWSEATIFALPCDEDSGDSTPPDITSVCTMTTSNSEGYHAGVDKSGGFYVYYVTASGATWTSLYSNASEGVAAGDVIRMESRGPHLSAWINGSQVWSGTNELSLTANASRNGQAGAWSHDDDPVEIVTNNTFTSATGWIYSSGWTITAGVLRASTANGVNAVAFQDKNTVAGRTYKVEYTVSNYSSGTVYIAVGGTKTPDETSNGSKVAYVTAATTGDVTVWGKSGSAFTGDIDDVYVTEVGGALDDFKIGYSFVEFLGSVPITITVVDNTNTPITTAAVRIETSSGVQIAQGTVNGSGVYSTSYSGSTPLSVTIKVRSSSSGETRYFPVRTSGTIASGTGLVTTVSMTPDTIAAA